MRHKTDRRLVGRDAEIAAWEELAAGAEAGTSAVWLVDGVPGIGKTTLLDVIRDAARDRGWRVLTSVGNPLAQDMDALGVLADWFDRLLVERATGEPPFDGPGVLLRDALAGLGSTPAGADLVRSITWTLRTLAEECPLLVVLDDAHWVNPMAAAHAAAAAAVVADEPIVFVFAHRTHARPEPFTALLERPHATSTTLTTLDVPDLDRWFREIGAPATPEQLREVAAVTGGVPLLVRAVLAQGGPDEPRSAPISQSSARTVAARRLAAVPGAAEVLAALTLLEEHATVDAVAHALGGSPATTLHRLTALEDADLAHPAGGTWTVTHPTVAEVALESADPAPIAARAVAVLRDRAVRSDRLATLVLRTRPGTVPEAGEILLRAAEDLVASGNADGPLALLDRLGLEADLAPTTALRATTTRGRAYALQGRTGAAAEELRHAIRLAPPVEHAGRWADLGDLHLGAGEVTEANAAYEQALQLITEPRPDLPTSDRRALLARLAAIEALSGRVGTLSQAEVGEILAQPQEQDSYGDKALLAMAALGMTIVGEDHALASTLALRAASDLRVVETDGVHGGVVSLLTGALNGTEQDERAFAVIDAAQALARRRGSVTSYATLAYTRAAVHHNRGELRRCEAEALAALDSRHDGWTLYLEAAQFMAVWSLLAQGRRADADDVLAEVDVDNPRGPLHAAMAHATLAAADMDGDRYDDALDHAMAARDLSVSFTGPAYGWFVRWAAFSAVQVGRHELARTYADEAVERARHYGAPRLLGLTLRTVSPAYEARQRGAMLDEAIRLLRGTHCGFELALAHRDRADLRAARGEVRLALEDARRSLELAERIGAAPTAAAVRDRIRTWGGGDSGTPAFPPESVLTASEYRVAELAAAGLSNREIAQRLFVIVKTVEWHLSRAYKKLGVSSRSELATLLTAPR